MDQKFFRMEANRKLKIKGYQLSPIMYCHGLKKAARPEKDTTYPAFSKLM
jgi:hypothetical protein